MLSSTASAHFFLSDAAALLFLAGWQPASSSRQGSANTLSTIAKGRLGPPIEARDAAWAYRPCKERNDEGRGKAPFPSGTQRDSRKEC